MSNIVRVTGYVPEPELRIGDMQPGDTGYTVPWAIKDGVLDEDSTLTEQGGPASVKITCTEPHKYAIHYETPRYH